MEGWIDSIYSVNTADPNIVEKHIVPNLRFLWFNSLFVRVHVLLFWITYRPLYKTLPRSNLFVNWISVRFYETDCICMWQIFCCFCIMVNVHMFDVRVCDHVCWCMSDRVCDCVSVIIAAGHMWRGRVVLDSPAAGPIYRNAASYIYK